MNMDKFQIHGFRLESMKNDATICMIAKRGTGKSYIVRDILYHYRHIPAGAVISPTDRLNPFFKNFFPDLYIHYEINSILLKKIMLRQTLMIEKSKQKKSIGKKIDPSSILVMDDCLARRKTWAKDETIMEIMLNGRHYRLTYILTMQTPLGIDPTLRLNFDYVFLLRETTTINRKKLWDNYAGVFPTLSTFIKVFEKCTEDHKAMVVDNRSTETSINKTIFWFKAKERRFTFGSKKFLELHKKYYDPNYLRRKTMEMLCPEQLLAKKKNEVVLDVVLKD